MKKRLERRLGHNIGTREERLSKRISLRNARGVSVRKFKTGKYLPRVEDHKHYSNPALPIRVHA